MHSWLGANHCNFKTISQNWKFDKDLKCEAITRRMLDQKVILVDKCKPFFILCVEKKFLTLSV